MNKFIFFAPLSVMVLSNGAFAQEGAAVDGELTSKDIDLLNGQEHYWKKVSGIETAKNQAIQLQIANKNLQKSAGIHPSGSSSENAYNEINSLQEFLNLSLKKKEVLKPEEAGEQAQIISANTSMLPHNIEIAGTVDSHGNAIQSQSQSKPKETDISAIQKEQQKFFEKMAEFLNSKISDMESKLNNGRYISNQTEQNLPNELGVEQVEPTMSDEDGVKFDYQSYESPFYKPTGKIKKVTPSGVEVVLAYEWKDYDEDTVFASTVISESDEEAVFYPMIRHIHKYKVVEFSTSRIKLLSENDEEIEITR
ncbi:hypothetical protein [Vibrio hepatarius]|uniref:hypothetical protein n=1 Tax=Vibrio hepatarius TaxID=171383 RepID=UPI001C08C17F|nr:hypothetical protein [Vibrio hepatarius]MBU2896067.1 hypothetical protein [Vibrio hepatarius]